jgi:hypothetical protein
MKWITNTYNPKLPDAKYNLVMEYYSPKDHEFAFRRHLEWLKDKIIGDPQATATHTVEELKKMNLVGVYEKG